MYGVYLVSSDGIRQPVLMSPCFVWKHEAIVWQADFEEANPNRKGQLVILRVL